MSGSRPNTTCDQGQLPKMSRPPPPPTKYEMLLQIQELTDVFKSFDANGDGLISWCELGGIMRQLGYQATEEELRRMVRRVDSNGDGYVDLHEFIEMNTKDMNVSKHMDDLRTAFKIFDLDKSGFISANELHQVLSSLGDPSTIDDCRDMITGIDCDGDGVVSFEEFDVLMMIP
eukprot:Gb_09531 [translate_table: standard]